MSSKKWARVKQDGAHGLRRGAWHPVVNDTLPNMVVLDVRKGNVPVPRSQLELSDDLPAAWSVVRWKQGQHGAQRASEQRYGLLYAVCPKCSNRQKLESADIESMACESCGQEFEVDWEHPC